MYKNDKLIYKQDNCNVFVNEDKQNTTCKKKKKKRIHLLFVTIKSGKTSEHQENIRAINSRRNHHIFLSSSFLMSVTPCQYLKQIMEHSIYQSGIVHYLSKVIYKEQQYKTLYQQRCLVRKKKAYIR